GPAAEHAQAAIERQLMHLVRLVDDLLDVERLARGRIGLRKTRIDAETPIRAAIDIGTALIEEKGQHFSTKLPEKERFYIDADSARTAQIVANLPDNAAKYTPQGGRIDLTLQRQGTDALITVKDSGIGIDPGLLPQLFQMFSQGERRTDSEHKGLGVGLA